MRIIRATKQEDIARIMRQINVDAYGIDIMCPKALTYLIKIDALSNICANILKQEMLSLGGDVAVSRDALTGKAKKTDCLIIANLSQLSRLSLKLKKQPFGLNKLATELTIALRNYQKDNFNLQLGKYKLPLGKRCCIMGIVNTTPDSFSNDGLLNKEFTPQNVVRYAQKLIKDGADIIDIGGESSRPGAKPVSLKEELRRTIPIIKLLAKTTKTPISIDTYKPEVAEQALDNGAALVNDITGLRNFSMAKIIARHKAAVVIMHMQGLPHSMQKNPKYTSLINEIIEFLKKSIDTSLNAGINEKKILIDPGIGFGKTVEHNLEILNKLAEFKVLGKPILIGTSRKSFIGKILKTSEQDRIHGTIASCILACENGANILRVHDVLAVKHAVLVQDNIHKWN